MIAIEGASAPGDREGRKAVLAAALELGGLVFPEGGRGEAHRPCGQCRAVTLAVGDQHRLILDAGIDDWGGVSPLTPDHVNPERPWPHIDELAKLTAQAGFTLNERLTIYPPYIREP